MIRVEFPKFKYLIMKKTIAFSSIFFIAFLFIAACTKPAKKTTSPVSFTGTSSSIGTFSATGSSVSAGGATGAKIEIDASSPSGTRMVLYMNPYTATTGIHLISGASVGGVYYSVTSDTVISSVHGNITLTSVTPDVIGTFNYTGSDSSIFSGSFEVPAP
jgi:hypothetical protein